MNNFPKVLLQKILFTVLIGVGCFVVGIVYYIFTHDRVMLSLSSILLLFSLFRGYGIFNIVTKQKYDVVVGTCVSVSYKQFRKYFTVKIMDDTGVESTLKLGKQAKVKIGMRYRFFFSRNERMPLGNEYFDTALSSGAFLGFEELGEFEDNEING